MQLITYAYAITLALTGFTNYATPQAQSTTSVNNSNRIPVHFAQKPNRVPARPPRVGRVRFVQPKLPDTGAPTGRRRGAAGRGNCSAVNPPLTALVPTVEQITEVPGEVAITHVWGLTVAEHPTFWFYIPDAYSSASSGEFVLQDEADNDIFRTPITLPERPGVVSVHLPSTLASLEIGKMYHWYFKIACGQQETASPVFVEGWVQRVTLSPRLASQLAAATPQQQIVLYAENGIWHEAVTSLAELRLTNPQDTTLAEDWTELLQSVGLNELTLAPMLQCCTPQNPDTTTSRD